MSEHPGPLPRHESRRNPRKHHHRTIPTLLCLLFASVLTSHAQSVELPAVTVTYTPAVSPIPNADGGMFENGTLTSETSASLAQHTATYNNQTFGPFRLLHTYICLNPVGMDYKECALTYPDPKPLTAADLANIDQQLAKIEPAGIKIILRFTYNFPSNTTSGQDAPLPVLLADIAELKPIIHKYAKVIYAMEVGFVGYWGEEHNSINVSPYTNDSIPAMTTILQAEVDAFGSDVTLLERDPPVLMALEPPSGPLFGTHDDRLAGDATDADTWQNKNYLLPTYDYTYNQIFAFGTARSEVTPFTGIFGLTPYPTLQNCTDLPNYFSDIHLNALNVGVGSGPEVFPQITGCIPEIFSKLGPQISLLSVKSKMQVKAGNNLRMHLKFTNLGYSSLFVRHPVYAVLTDTNGNPLPQFDPVRISIDLTQIAPGKVGDATAQINIPSSLETQNVFMALWMPDPDPELAQDHRYNYLLNNASVPNPATGLNVLFPLTIR
jgi:hypothetical protein